MVATVSLAVSAIVAKEAGLVRACHPPRAADSDRDRARCIVAASAGLPGPSVRSIAIASPRRRGGCRPLARLRAAHVGAEPGRHAQDSDVTLGIDHYSVQGALALALALLPLLAALRADLHPFVCVSASVAASYLGLVSLAWPDAAGGLGRAWSLAAMTWALALLAATFADRIRAVPLHSDPPAG